MAGVDKYVKLMLHFVGPDAGVNFLDNSPIHRAMTVAGGIQISTANFKFNQSSGLFDGGTTSLLTAADSPDFYVAAADFTVDFWIKKNGDSIPYVLFGQWDAGTGTRSIEMTISSDILQCNFWYGVGTFVQITSLSTITGTAWHHLAFERYGNTIYGYVDGTSIGNADVTGRTATDAPGVFGVGSLGDLPLAFGGRFIGNMAEFRFSNGISRYRGTNFTPPTFPYSNILSNQQMQNTL